MTEPDTEFHTDDVLRERDQIRDELLSVEAAALQVQQEYEKQMADLRERLRQFTERAVFLEGVLTGRGVPLDTPAPADSAAEKAAQRRQDARDAKALRARLTEIEGRQNGNGQKTKAKG